MGYRGDLEMLPCWSQATIKMSTAIMLAYSPEGFVIAADGLQKHSEDPSKDKLSAQKILDISDSRNHIACALTGIVQYTADNTDETVFDFNHEVLSAATALQARRCKNLHGYAIRLSRIINERLRTAASDGLIADLLGRPIEEPGVNDIAMLILAGIYDGWPQIAYIHFRHKDQRILDPRVLETKATSGTTIIVGSREVQRLLFSTDDARFTAYRTYDPRLVTLKEQIKICGSYIRACCDPEAINIDPRCVEIGGHLHIATISPEGFAWVIPPMGIAATAAQ